MPQTHKKDPNNPTDLLGRPLQVGDEIAWAFTRWDCAALAVGEIIEFTYRQNINQSYSKRTKKVLDPTLADTYSIKVRVKASSVQQDDVKSITMIDRVVRL